jgi:hypothetical protein
VVAHYALRPPGLDKVLDEFDDSGTVRATIGQVADKDQTTFVPVPSFVVVAQMSHQLTQCVDITVKVADDVQWTVKQWLDQVFRRHALTLAVDS